MKLINVFIVMAVVLVAFFSVQIITILNNNESLKNINIALRSNIDAVLVEANIRGFSTHIQVKIFDKDQSISTTQIQKLYRKYDNSIEEFKKIVSEIESGESKRSSTEISEELIAHQKTLSDAIKLSGELKNYFSEKSGPPADELFDNVFESSTLSLELDNKHVNELKEEDDELLRSVNSITFILIVLEIVLLPVFILFLILYMVNPVKKLTKTIEDISLGKLDAEVEGKERKDEIGDLARAFDRTLISLKMAMKKAGLKEPEVREILEQQKKEVTGEALLKSGLLKAKKKDDGENKANGNGEK